MSVKIIAGKYRGMQLEVPRSARPTLSRHRTAIFDLLEALEENFFLGKAVLDCFAGSGAMGFEAISRGASRVYFVDNDKNSVSLIKANLIKLKEQENCVVICSDVHRLKKIREGYNCDLVFIDPPYFEDFSLQQFLPKLLEKHWISNDTLLLLEQSVHRLEHIDFFQEIKTKKIGGTLFSLGKISPRAKVVG
ncbi:MAG: 16S rRNA (guanine(966)-N(2))-methyltransferase RsmD [Holosporaceae bacterium]|jgi:16S rRNA (guanine966-N2)-methyltransferase|nr:16S rRNA (guanine(966)-N(2))-methyltransferase RsmD [Holosporaceae bacterium]